MPSFIGCYHAPRCSRTRGALVLLYFTTVKGRWTEAAKLKRWVFEQTWLRAHPDVIFRVNPEDP